MASKNGVDDVSRLLESLASFKNDPIPAAEVAAARAAHLAAEQELLQINANIQALESRRTALLSQLAVYRVALAPHKILSVDIVTEIFNLCAQGPAKLNYIVGRRSQDIRFILCQICSRWRTIALDNLRLWSEVNLDYNLDNISQVLKALLFWLYRARGSTLYLDINAPEADLRVTHLLAKYSQQCHTLILRGLRFTSPLFSLPAGSLSRVETLHLASNYSYGSRDLVTPPATPISVFDDMPFLKSVTLQDFHHFFDPTFLPLPWRRLTSVYFDNTNPTASQYYSVLQGCAYLTKSRLDVFTREPLGKIELSDCKVALPALRVLELNTDVLGNAARFLQSVALDSLVDLSLSLSDDCDNTIFSVRSFPALQRLSLEGPGIGSQSDLEAWLHACPAAIDVWIPDYFILDSLMEQIADGRLLPRVQILTFGSAIPAHLIAALEARQRSTACSTIVETGLTSDGVEHWELQASEKMGIASLRMMGAFVARCEASTRPRLGQIKQAAILNAEEGLDPFVWRPKFPC